MPNCSQRFVFFETIIFNYFTPFFIAAFCDTTFGYVFCLDMYFILNASLQYFVIRVYHGRTYPTPLPPANATVV